MIKLSELRLNISRNTSIFIPPMAFLNASIYLLLWDSGCGKTSFLKALSGFIPENQIVGTVPKIRTALLLQNPMHQMITTTVESELKFPLIQHGYGEQDVRKKSEEIAVFFGLDALLNNKLYDLSFGELQSVMLAATLLIPADLILLDEPTSHLDYPAIEKMYAWIRKHGKQSVFLIASQFPDEYRFADYVIHFQNHQLIHSGPAKDYPHFVQKNRHLSTLASDEIQAYLKAMDL